MSAYLKFFELEQSPFEGKAQAKVVLGTRALRDAFAAIRGGLEDGSARICVNGGPGLGKTTLARSLPKLLGDSARVALVFDPSGPWESLRSVIARQWGLAMTGLGRNGLLDAAKETRLVLVVDRAETASEEFLDHLDVMLSVRSEGDEPAVQSVLLACLSRDAGGATEASDPAPLVWWLDRIQTLQLEFAPIPREGVESYIHKHLKRAGWRGKKLFSPEAAAAIHSVTGGIPGEISTLCETLLASAAQSDRTDIDEAFVLGWLQDESEDSASDDAGVQDEFEDLALEEVFEGADPEATDAPVEPTSNVGASSLAESLEHFEETGAHPDSAGIDRVEDEATSADAGWVPEEAFEDQTDHERAELASLEAYLDRPPTDEELHSIRRNVRNRQLRVFGALVAAALIGAFGLVWLSGGADSGDREAGRSMVKPIQSREGRPTDKPLARLRGPIVEDSLDAATAAPTKPPRKAPERSAAAASGPKVAQTSPRAAAPEPGPVRRPARSRSLDEAEDHQDVVRPEDFVDMRPASMRGDAGR